MDLKRPIVIAGPCSVESQGQLQIVVDSLAELSAVAMVRCGVWKPRSLPGGFEGYGEEALCWMAEVSKKGREKGRAVPMVCEVARPEHVEKALKHAIDGVWIGARTTANPFMVQEVAEALRGSGLRVLVKNAPSPDVRLWIGAVERCRRAGVAEVMAVHRGFDLYENGGYRNDPLWEIPIEMRRAMPEVPIITDPSHIAGCRELLAEVSQMALDLGFDGLMLEVHPCPEAALTDSRQQITPVELRALLEGLQMRSAGGDGLVDGELRLLRGQIDRIDDRLLRLLTQRLAVVRQIARVKSAGNMAVFQPQRWDALLRQRLQQAEMLGVDKSFVRELFEKVHAESVAVQRECMRRMQDGEERQ